ncbi:MAG: alpha/beta hydrolase [Pseudomonadota bacterium]
MADIELKHEDVGSGSPAIMLIHGFSSGPEDWAGQAEHLASRHRVISVALRGHGISGRGEAPMSMEQLATDCLEILKDKGIDNAILAGHSMGTRVAIEAHRQAPDVVKGLILMDGSNSTAQSDLNAALANFEATVEKLGYTGFAKMLFEQMFYDPKHDALKERYVARALKVPEEVGTPLYKNLITWDGTVTSKALAAADIPILVVQSTTRDAKGGRRTLEPGEVGAYESFVLQHATHADIVGMPGLGHYTMTEAPAEVNVAIDKWLDQHSLR